MSALQDSMELDHLHAFASGLAVIFRALLASLRANKLIQKTYLPSPYLSSLREYRLDHPIFVTMG